LLKAASRRKPFPRRVVICAVTCGGLIVELTPPLVWQLWTAGLFYSAQFDFFPNGFSAFGSSLHHGGKLARLLQMHRVSMNTKMLSKPDQDPGLSEFRDLPALVAINPVNLSSLCGAH